MKLRVVTIFVNDFRYDDEIRKIKIIVTKFDFDPNSSNQKYNFFFKIKNVINPNKKM